MSKKNHTPGPVPPGNRTHNGPGFQPTTDGDEPAAGETSAPRDQEEDEQRRLGDFVGKGEHSLQQPGPLNDGDKHSK